MTEQELQQRLLRVQSIAGFLPHHAVGRVDHLGGHFFAAMCGQAMHEQRIGLGAGHHGRADLVGREGAAARRRFGFLPHADPDVRHDQIGAGKSLLSCEIVVTDEAGVELLTVPLTEVALKRLG